MTRPIAPYHELDVLGVKMHAYSSQHAQEIIMEFFERPDEKFHLIVTLGTEMVMRAQWDHDFRRVVNQSDLVVPDSIGVVWAANHCQCPVQERVPGIDLVTSLLPQLAEHQIPIYLLGGQPGISLQASHRMQEMAPGLLIAGHHHGYFQEDQAIIDDINASGAKLILSALGFPRQELWLAKYGHQTQALAGIGVGGTFDVLAGHLARAPIWMQRFGMEWLYRLLRQPSRLPRMMSLPQFALQVALSQRAAVKPRV